MHRLKGSKEIKGCLSNALICILLCMQILPRYSPAGDASRTIQGAYIDPMHNAVVHGMMEHIISSGTVKQMNSHKAGTVS